MKKKNHAFTLVELLVVICIISTLIALLIPSLKRAKLAASELNCASNVRQILLASQMYANDNHGFYPPNVSAPQGRIQLDRSGNNPYGTAILVCSSYISAKVLYSPPDQQDTPVKSYYVDQPIWDELVARGFLGSPATEYLSTSYVLREPVPKIYTGIDFQQIAPSQTTNYIMPFRPKHRMAMVADRFMGPVSHWSYHGGLRALANVYSVGNGRGWHVGFSDGSVMFFKNDPNVYSSTNTQHAAQDYATRSHDWTYWDSLQTPSN